MGYDCGTPNEKTLIYNVVVRMSEQCPPALGLPPVVDYVTALVKVSLAPLLGRIVELTLLKQE